MRGALGGNVEVAVPLRLVSSTGGRRVSLRMTPHRSPPPWMVEEHNDACFIVRDATGQARARSAVSGQATQQGRGPHGGELRQAAGAAAAGAADKRSVTRCNRPRFTTVRAMSAYRPPPEVSLHRNKCCEGPIATDAPQYDRYKKKDRQLWAVSPKSDQVI